MEYIGYFLFSFGFGISFYYIFYSNNSMNELERAKHNLSVRKEWFKMLADQKTNKSKWPENWS
jgi:hypothetical protein